MNIRLGSIDDFDKVMRLLDEAVVWLVAEGRTGQWGSEALSGRPESVERLRAELDQNELWMVEIDGEPVGAMLLGNKPMPYVAEIEEPELYLHLLVTSAHHRGSGIGRVLVNQARVIADERNIDLVRVDCYAGDDRKLVAAYERLGFTPTEQFTVKDWPGQILAMRLSDVSEV